jgi:hypothetical protein
MVAIFVAAVGPPLSVVATVWFLAVCPGVSLVRLLRIDDPLTTAVLTVSLSLSIDALVNLPLLWAGNWTPARAFAALFVISLTGAMVDAWLGSAVSAPPMAPCCVPSIGATCGRWTSDSTKPPTSDASSC